MKLISYIFMSIIIGLAIVTGLVIHNGITYANHKKDYTLDVYTDTIYDYVIVTTVANNGNNIGVSSIIVNDICDFSNNN